MDIRSTCLNNRLNRIHVINKVLEEEKNGENRETYLIIFHISNSAHALSLYRTTKIGCGCEKLKVRKFKCERVNELGNQKVNMNTRGHPYNICT